MMVGKGLRFPVVSDNSVGLSWTLSLDFWHLPRSDRPCSLLVVNREHCDPALGVPSLPRSSFPDNLLPAFVGVASASRSPEPVSYGSSQPSDRFDLKIAAVRGHGTSSAAAAASRDKGSPAQNRFVNERLRGDAGAKQQAAPVPRSDPVRSSQAELRNAGQGALSGSAEEEMLLREARYREVHHRRLNSDPEEWKSLARGAATQQAFSQVPSSQLMKGAELRLDDEAQGGLDDRKSSTNIWKRADGKQKQGSIHDNQTPEDLHATQIAMGNFWTFAEIKSWPAMSNSLWGKVGITVLIAGALFFVIQMISSMERSSQRHSVKRRIIRSQWYGNSGSQMSPRRNFHVKRPEFPRYPILEVDGDKKTFRFPVHGGHARRPSFDENDQWASEAKVGDPMHGSSAVAETRAKYNKELAGNQFTPKKKVLSSWASHEKAPSASQYIAPEEHKLTGGPWSFSSLGQESDIMFSQHKLISSDDEPSASVNPMRWSILGGTFKRGENLAQPSDMKEELEQKVKMDDESSPRADGKSQWQEEDELDLDRRIRKLRHTVQAVEQHRRAALLALAEERQRSMELEEEISRQKEAANTLEKEVQLLKESHDALLTSLRKKYSSPAAARAAADLIYQDWESGDETSVSEAVVK